LGNWKYYFRALEVREWMRITRFMNELHTNPGLYITGYKLGPVAGGFKNCKLLSLFLECRNYPELSACELIDISEWNL
jgi:hypothetical protein